MIQKDKSILADEFDDGESNDWIVTYADLVSLLLVFFVLMYTISSVDLIKFKRIMAAVKNNLGATQIADNPSVGSDGKEDKMKSSVDLGDPLMEEKKKAVEDIKEELKNAGLQGNVGVRIIDGKITIRVRGRILFKSGSATLKRESKKVLEGIVKIVGEYPDYVVNIKGHTDNVPIATREFPSNWELSSIRATNVLKYLIQEGINPKRLTATGYGDILPIIPNNSEKQRAKNRRIEFVLEKEAR